MVSMNFNATQHEPQNGEFDALPAGEYQACIVSSEIKDTKKRDGRYLELTIEIIDGQSKGRMVWERLNIQNPNADAVAIANGRLSAICHALAVMEISDSAQLHNKPMIIKVKKVKRADNGEWSNEIAGYFSMSEKKAALQGTTASSAPWMSKNEPPF
ncbi:MAG: DUF669 domain-containing protein [Planctomycetes bacterium]|nr:DUF669 domain-containing protein [Planctomycetota bacterium]